ncbi:ENTH domain-containing protein [Pyronema domesticum]|nr:ENTH domain-containing protein [Pyronema domesticum]
MASSFEKSVKGATKHKLAAPKAKYVEHILIATHAGEAGVAEVFRALSNRLRESSWTTVFKGLIVIHYMIREGERDVALRFLKRNLRILALSHYNDAQIQGRNLRHYANYIHVRAEAFGAVKTDYVRDNQGRLRKLSVEKGLLREVECVQAQIKAALKCTFLDDEVDNEITLLAFRLLVSDLLELFHVVNEGVINVLEHYFEMSRTDAEVALKIYKLFTAQTADVVEFLQSARRVEVSTRLQIPNIKHAPTSLTSSLEEYLNDPDFDVNRRQYLAAREAKSNGNKGLKPASSDASRPTTASAPPKPEPPKIAPDLIDFFESIEQEQTPMFPQNQQQQPMMTGAPQMMGYGGQMGQMGQPQMQQQMFTGAPVMAGQMPNFPGPQFNNPTNPFPSAQPSQTADPSTNPFPAQMAPPQSIQAHTTGFGFGGYTPAPDASMAVPQIPPQFRPQTSPNFGGMAPPPFPQFQPQQTGFPPLQQGAVNFPGQQPPAQLQVPATTGTNPFRQSMLGHSPSTAAKGTNPFARSPSSPPATSAGLVSLPSNATGSSLSPSMSVSGTNPFNRGISPQATGGSALTVPGGTNPFRASMLMQQQQALLFAAGQGNGSGQTGTMGGLEQGTVKVFPREGAWNQS